MSIKLNVKKHHKDVFPVTPSFTPLQEKNALVSTWCFLACSANVFASSTLFLERWKNIFIWLKLKCQRWSFLHGPCHIHCALYEELPSKVNFFSFVFGISSQGTTFFICVLIQRAQCFSPMASGKKNKTKNFKNCVLLDKFASTVLNCCRERQIAWCKTTFVWHAVQWRR